MNKEKNFVSANVYVNNCAKSIGDFLEKLVKLLEENFEHSEIICVNDGSNDGSCEVIREVAKNTDNTTITILNMSYYHGMEAAMNAAMDLAIGDFVFEFDLSFMDYEPEVIMDVYSRALMGYDIVSASPDKSQKLSSSLFYSVFNRFSDSTVKMRTESFRILSRRVINRIKSMNAAMVYRKALYAGCGLKGDNIVYRQIETKGSATENESGYRRGLAVDSLIMFTNVGYKLSFFVTTMMIFITLFMIVYSLVIYLGGNPVEGWTTTVLFLSVAFFGLFAILTIVIKYLQLIIDLVFKKKRYSFESIEKLK